MRRITARERNLLAVFGLVILAVITLFGFRALSGFHTSLSRQVDQLRLEQRADQGLLADKTLWEARGRWLDQKEPHLVAESNGDASFLEYLQSSTHNKDLTITEQRLNDPVSGPAGRGASVELEIHGSLQSLVEWLTALQTPENFRSVSRLTLKSDAEPPKVSCALTVIQWYSPQP